jgi:lysine-specific demethylase/histidyl-hydroxylase NO66
MATVFESFVRSPTAESFVAASLQEAVIPLRSFLAAPQDLVSVDEVTAMLRRIAVSPGLMQVTCDGHVIREADYLRPSVSSAGSQCYVHVERLGRLFSNGATLTLYHCSSLLPRVAMFCDVLATLWRVRVEASLVMTIATGKPGRLHWDGSDSLICQIEGQKRWPVGRPLYAHPLDNGVPDQAAPTPVWDDVLAPGDALFVPRGWLHQPCCTASPSIHLTFSPMRPTGVDLLKDVLATLEQETVVRSDLPLLLTTDQRLAYSRQLKDAVMRQLDSALLEARYQAYQLIAR